MEESDPYLSEEDDGELVELAPHEMEIVRLEAKLALAKHAENDLRNRLAVATLENDVLRMEREVARIADERICYLRAWNARLVMELSVCKAKLASAMSTHTPAPVSSSSSTSSESSKLQKQYDQLLSKFDLMAKRADAERKDMQDMQDRMQVMQDLDAKLQEKLLAQAKLLEATNAQIEAMKEATRARDHTQAVTEARLICAQMIFSLKEKVGTYVFGPPPGDTYHPRNLFKIKKIANENQSTKRRWDELHLDTAMFTVWAKITEERSAPLHPKCIHGGLYTPTPHRDCRPTKEEMMAVIERCGLGDEHRYAAETALAAIADMNARLYPGDESSKYRL